MLLSAVAGNALRTGGENFKEVAKGEKNIVGSVKLRDKENTSILSDAVLRAGIMGPFEYGKRIDDTNKFKNKILASITTLTGPATSDVISFIVQGRITETAFNNLPLATLLQKLHPEKYKEVQKYFREIDKEVFGSDPYTAPSVPFSVGGEVVDQRQRNFKGGEISEDYPVTDVAKNPADRKLDNLPLSFNEVASNEENPEERINPFTGEPYTALYYRGGTVRKQYNEGGSDDKKVLKPNYLYNNMGNIEARYDSWAGRIEDVYYKKGREEGYGGFDSRIAGIRAPLRDFNTKLERYKNTEDPEAHAVLEYLGGGRVYPKDHPKKGQFISLEEKMAIAKKENKNPEQYIADLKYLRNKLGPDRGIIHAVAMNEQTPEGLEYFLESEDDIQKAIETSKYDYIAGTTTAQMLKDLEIRNRSMENSIDLTNPPPPL